MKNFIKQIITKRTIIGFAIGLTFGFVYKYYSHCNSGNCLITKNYTYTVIFFAIAGVLLAYKKPPKKEEEEIEKVVDEDENITNKKS